MCREHNIGAVDAEKDQNSSTCCHDSHWLELHVDNSIHSDLANIVKSVNAGMLLL